MNVITPSPLNPASHCSLITPRSPDKVMLYSFDHYSMNKTTQPYQIIFDRQKHIPYYLLKCLKHVTFRKILGRTYCRLHYFCF